MAEDDTAVALIEMEAEVCVLYGMEFTCYSSI